jgi:hypothetical protein
LRRKRRGRSLWPWTTRHIRTARGCGWLRTSYATKTKSSCSTVSPPTYVHTDGVLTRTHNRQLSHPCHGVESKGTYSETLLQTLSGWYRVSLTVWFRLAHTLARWRWARPRTQAVASSMHAPGAAASGAGELYIMRSQYLESSRLQQSYIDVSLASIQLQQDTRGELRQGDGERRGSFASMGKAIVGLR